MNTDDTNEDLDELKRSVIERVSRCARAMASELERSWETCGKASCARSGRCRGFACGLKVADGDALSVRLRLLAAAQD